MSQYELKLNNQLLDSVLKQCSRYSIQLFSFSASENVASTWKCLAFPLNVDWSDDIIMAVQRMKDAGLIGKFMRDPLPLKAIQRAPPEDTVEPLPLTPFVPPLIAFAACLVFCTAIFVVEKFKKMISDSVYKI